MFLLHGRMVRLSIFIHLQADQFNRHSPGDMQLLFTAGTPLFELSGQDLPDRTVGGECNIRIAGPAGQDDREGFKYQDRSPGPGAPAQV